jgi:release factor glutamine methyltransferase
MSDTLGDWLRQAKARLAEASSSASLDAQLIAAEILDANRAHIIAHPERPLTDSEHAALEAWLARRATGEPMAYILGRRAWYDREMIVSPAVLIPRPETELLLEMALESPQAARPRAIVADIGTGSGALAVTFAALTPHSNVHAVDISPEALEIARANAQAQQAFVTFHQGDLLAPLISHGLRLDILMANLPYIADGELPALEVTRHEPRLALGGGDDGLDLIRRLLRQAPDALASDALLLLEIGHDQGAAVILLVREAFPDSQVSLHQDLAGLDRIVRADIP